MSWEETLLDVLKNAYLVPYQIKAMFHVILKKESFFIRAWNQINENGYVFINRHGHITGSYEGWLFIR